MTTIQNLFENKTVTEIVNEISPGNKELEAVLQRYSKMSSSDDYKIDAGLETYWIAKHFATDSNLASLLDSTSITKKDAEDYIYRHRMGYYDQNRGEVAEEYDLDLVKHPFVNLFQHIKPNRFALLKGLPVFEELGEQLPELLPTVSEKRSLNVLYPAAGAHIAPILLALQLIDNDQIDSAEFTYTEIEEDYFDIAVGVLETAVSKGLIESARVDMRENFTRGYERKIHIKYKGKTITINYAFNRSGKSYYRQDDLRESDLVILHDPGNGHIKDTYDLVADILQKKKTAFPKKEQLVLVEGKETYQREDSDELKLPFANTEIPGTYGHCDGYKGLGEIYGCDYNSAYVIPLNQQALIKLAWKHPDNWRLSIEIYSGAYRAIMGPIIAF